MDNFNYREFIYGQSLFNSKEDEKQQLNENAPGYDTRKFGEALPTLESVKAAHEAKQKEDDVKEQMYIDDEEFEMEMGRSKKDSLRKEMMIHVSELLDGNIDMNDFINVVEDIMSELK
jgi:hypothetical protein